MKSVILLFSLSCIVAFVHCYGGSSYNPLMDALKARRQSKNLPDYDAISLSAEYSPVHIAPQGGFKEADRIKALPGQPNGVDVIQYSGYVTVDSKAERAFFYYFVESQDSASKPLVLWLNGGPGCSSFGNGAMQELGPFRVDRDQKTLSFNKYAWNNVANVLFLESPAGVGFSYSNTSSDYDLNGDEHTAQDNYAFLLNWLERFPEYKDRDFYIAGESYAGHYAPQLAQKIIRNNKIKTHPVINLRGVAVGNAWIDDEMSYKGMYDNYWTHAFLPDEMHRAIGFHCNFANRTPECDSYVNRADSLLGNINVYNIYAPLCNPNSTSSHSDSEFDPCSNRYVLTYLNSPKVQKALHVKGALPQQWQSCNDSVNTDWKDWQVSVLPTILELMGSGIRVWAYSGDIDGIVSTTTTRYSINKLKPSSMETPWYPWYYEKEIGGYVVAYENLTLVTIRGAGHFVPSYQPARALAFFSSFLNGTLPPSQ